FQISSAGCQRWRDAIVGSLQRITAARAVYERSDADVLELEGLEPRTGLAAAKLTTQWSRLAKAEFASGSTWPRGTKPGITWTNATTGCRSGVLLQAGTCSIVSVIRAGSRCRRWRTVRRT